MRCVDPDTTPLIQYRDWAIKSVVVNFLRYDLRPYDYLVFMVVGNDWCDLHIPIGEVLPKLFFNQFVIGTYGVSYVILKESVPLDCTIHVPLSTRSYCTDLQPSCSLVNKV